MTAKGEEERPFLVPKLLEVYHVNGSVQLMYRTEGTKVQLKLGRVKETSIIAIYNYTCFMEGDNKC